jgi:hypothetical protein
MGGCDVAKPFAATVKRLTVSGTLKGGQSMGMRTRQGKELVAVHVLRWEDIVICQRSDPFAWTTSGR